MTDRQALTRRAPAKLNLALAVGPPRESDGLHPIASWMATIDLCDTVTIRRLGEGEPSRFEIGWAPHSLRPTPIDWPIERDLAVCAVRALEAKASNPLPVAMRIEKNIPVGAGLGGGSSDTAAALLGMRELFMLEITDERLAMIAHGLGSDIPFFLCEGAALVTGLGDEIERTPPIIDPGVIALFVPPFGCVTGAVYRAFDAIEQDEFRADLAARLAREAVVRNGDCFNDLASAAERVEPALAEFRARIEASASVRVHITGSGSAMFVLCEDRAEGERVIESARRYAGSVAGVVTSFAS